LCPQGEKEGAVAAALPLLFPHQRRDKKKDETASSDATSVRMCGKEKRGGKERDTFQGHHILKEEEEGTAAFSVRGRHRRSFQPPLFSCEEKRGGQTSFPRRQEKKGGKVRFFNNSP